MLFTKFKKKLIFVIGSGRSGTHLLGRTFGNSEEIEAFIEDDRFFWPISELAAGINVNKKEFNKILKKYRRNFNKSKKEYILEKTHPNIWFVEDILKFFPEAKFIGIKRNVFATVSSMLRHKGVLSWYDRLPLDESNRFLGITESNKGFFEELPLESKCAYRWLSHAKRLEILEDKFPENVMLIEYEDFYNNYQNLMINLKMFLKLDFDLNSEPLNVSGKDKWKENLSELQIENIKKVITI